MILISHFYSYGLCKFPGTFLGYCCQSGTEWKRWEFRFFHCDWCLTTSCCFVSISWQHCSIDNDTCLYFSFLFVCSVSFYFTWYILSSSPSILALTHTTWMDNMMLCVTLFTHCTKSLILMFIKWSYINKFLFIAVNILSDTKKLILWISWLLGWCVPTKYHRCVIDFRHFTMSLRYHRPFYPIYFYCMKYNNITYRVEYQGVGRWWCLFYIHSRSTAKKRKGGWWVISELKFFILRRK